MKTRLLKFIRSGSIDSDNKRQDRIPIFLFCLFLATIFWVLTALTKEYSTHINVPVSFSGIPSDKVLANSLPSKFELVIRGSGFNLRRFLFSNTTDSIKIDLSKLTYSKSQTSKTEVNLSKEYFESIFKTKLKGDIEIIELNPGLVKIEFKNLSVKRIPVKLNAEITFARSFGYAGPVRIEPASILVSGDSEVLNDIDSISTKLFKAKGLEQDLSENIEIDIPIKSDIRTDLKGVRIFIPVEKYTEGRIMAKVKVRNLNQTSRLRLIPDEVEIVYTVPLSLYTKAESGLFEVFVDLQGTDLERATRLKVNVGKHPDFVKIMSIDPVSLDFILKK